MTNKPPRVRYGTCELVGCGPPLKAGDLGLEENELPWTLKMCWIIWIYTGVHVLENHIFWFLGVCNFWRMFFLLIVGVDLRCRWSLLYFMLMFFFCKINHPPSDMSFEFVWEGLHPQKKLVSEISTKHNFQALLQTWQFEYREIQLSVVTISRVFQPLLTCSITICKVFPANNGPLKWMMKLGSYVAIIIIHIVITIPVSITLPENYPPWN